MEATAGFSALAAEMPALRRFSSRFSPGDRAAADDLVQMTLIRAMVGIGGFEAGTGLRGWLWVIMRNEAASRARGSWRESQDVDGEGAARLSVGPTQDARLRLLELAAAIDGLPATHREALELVALGGLSYEAAAVVVGCPEGTIKSRVHRAREALAAY